VDADVGGVAAASAAPDATSVAGAAAAASLSHAAANTEAAQAAALSLTAVGAKHPHDGDNAAAAPTAAGDAAAGMSQLNGAASTGAADVTPAPSLQVHAGVDTPEFAQGLAQRVSWMVGNGLNSAKLQVNPPQLGPIELSISVQGDHAAVAMVTHSAVTRDALESSTSALKDMLGAQGFAQVSVDISQRSFQERSAYTPPSYDRAPSNARGSAAAPLAAAVTGTSRAAAGALDAYA
jgi:flagellar hook-length control protein FliK